jgi:hypothetical protein
MKKIFILFMVLSCALRLPAQTNVPVRLALVSESEPAGTAADVLTAEFSANPKVQLLEWDQIAKVYQEQRLSGGNTDYIKLGQLLGADGLLLLQAVTEGTNQYLDTRLVAVKPGVVLIAERYDWPLKDPTGWSAIYARHLDGFLPKLTVQLKDAIPLSVVNLRSAMTSAEAGETERRLKVLTIQRLSQEPQLFVLERQRMKLLGEEKDLKNDDWAFWNGSYLLEGVVDQNGYSPDTITINGRLTPKGAAPVDFMVSGARTNLTEVINELALKVDEVLKINPTAREWNAADEARQYFEEAKWAMRWGVYPEAQAAAESAWALGKKDEECAIARVQAWKSEIDTGGYTSIPFTNPDNLQDVTNSAWGAAAPGRPWGLVLSEEIWQSNTNIFFTLANKFPDEKNLDRAIRTLEVFQEYSRNLDLNKPVVDSAWQSLGNEDLIAASEAYWQNQTSNPTPTQPTTP